MVKKIFDNLLNKFGKEKITIVVLIGILLMVISLPSGSKKNSQTSNSTKIEGAQTVQNSYTFSEYEQYLENKLKNALDKVDGVGEVCVIVSLESTGKKILATDDEANMEQKEESDGTGNKSVSVNNSSKSTNIYYETQNGEQPYVTSENMPEVKGIVIVAKGGGDGKVASEITLAVEALLDVPTHKIKVLKMS